MRDFAPVAAAFALYPVVALAQGADRTTAVRHASAIAEAEQSLGLFVEPAAYAWAAGIPWLLAAAGVAYLVLHVPVLLGALAWVYLARPAAFPRLRTAFLAAQTLTLAGYLLVPTAPPRMLGGLGFGDTLAELWGAQAAAGAHWLQSPFAAMPSGHVVFALLAGGALALHARRVAWRVAGALYPGFVAALTIVTANHFWLDAAGSVAVVAVAVPTALLAHRAPRRPARAYASGSG